MRRSTLARRLPVILCAAAGLLLVGGLIPVALGAARDAAVTPPPPGAGEAVAAEGALGPAIGAAQRRLRTVPNDWTTWAALGTAYVEQARISGDPTYYPKAEGALQQSLTIRPAGNWPALTGLGALANARHDFPAALDFGRRAERVNAAAAAVQGVLADALTQLGDADGARAATQRMLDVQPGVASFTRASYDLELHGQTGPARDALERALAESTAPADIAFCHYYLGELAFNNGDGTGALAHYEAGLAAADAPPLHAGRGRVLLAQGRTADALAEYDLAVTRLPLPNLVAEYGDALTAAGRPGDAAAQYDLHAAQQRLFAANGVADHLGDATFRADHGDPAGALEAARAEWAQRHQVLVADALAWALHRNGQDAEALGYADQALALGWRNATFLYHRGAIHLALGHADAARRDLTDALAVNPAFDPLQAPQARQLLQSLGGRR